MSKASQLAGTSAMPSAAQARAMKKTAGLALERVRNQSDRHARVTSVEFGGSYAKGTWLPRGADLDIFVKFKKSTPPEEFVGISQQIGFAALDGYCPSVRYSNHPYVEGNIHGTKINVVPCYDVARGRWKSAADRSPWHTKHMRECLTPRMQNDVRILKTFLRSAGIYGAEIARQGFSGYVSEVLVEWFGSFEKVVREAAKAGQAMTVGNPKKRFGVPVVIADPVDGKRNLAAAISYQNVGRFALYCRAYQSSPGRRFFRNNAPRKSLVDSGNVVVVRFNFRPRSPEIIWGQAKKATVSLATQMGKAGFNVLRHMAHTDEKGKAWLLFLLESAKISKMRVREGPGVFMGKNADGFVRKNVQTSRLMWVDGDRRLLTLEEREFSDATKYLLHLLGGGRLSLPKGLEDDFKAGFWVSAGTGRMGKSIKEAASELVSTDEAFFHFD